MMETIVAIAGAIQLTRWFMALIEAVEKPSAPPPSKARRREPSPTNHHREADKMIIQVSH